MPRVLWPEQPTAVLDVSGQYSVALGERVKRLLTARQPPAMSADLARAFLRCFYAARDTQRAARDLADGGAQTEAFRAAALARRVGELQRRAQQLEDVLVREAGA